MVGGTSNFLFINADGSDRGTAEALARELSRTVPCVLPDWEGRYEQARRNLEDCLVNCAGVLIVYEKASLVWLRNQLVLLRKLRHRRSRPLRVCAIVTDQTDAVFEAQEQESRWLQVANAHDIIMAASSLFGTATSEPRRKDSESGASYDEVVHYSTKRRASTSDFLMRPRATRAHVEHPLSAMAGASLDELATLYNNAKSGMSLASGQGISTSSDSDIVDVSAFAPKGAHPGQVNSSASILAHAGAGS
jgi:hypothetical protein